ncbi:MAG: DUF1761 domain-containing protein [Maribacter sp.]|nr:DUF1761 domain-containing protein [Maribacter sp.]
MENINILSLVISTLIPMLLGTLWYSKALFGKAWMESIGMTEEKQKSGNMPLIMGLAIVMAFLMSFFLLNFNNGPGQEGEFDTFGHGVAHGVVLSLFLIIPTFVSNGLFEQKPWKNIIINCLYWLVALALMSGVLDVMNHWPNTV